MDSTSHLGGTIELTLLAEVWVSQPEVVSIGELSNLSYGGMGGREMPSPHQCLRQVGELALRLQDPGELSLPLSSCSTGRVGPAPFLGNTVELALKV